MRYNRLDLNLLVALKVLLAEKSVTRAAEAVHMTQSTMSGILARLRDYFEDPLIVQVGRNAELTPLAERLVEPVNDVLLRIDATIATRPEFNPRTSLRQFSIMASDYVVHVLLLDVLRKVHQLAPGVTIELRASSATAAAELEAGEVDLVISPDRFISQTASGHNLFNDNYVVIVDCDNQEVGDTITLEQYQSLGHISYQGSDGGWPLFETWFAKEHGNGRRIEVWATNFQILPHFVLGTSRLATMHTRLAEKYIQHLPVRVVKPLFETPKLVEVLQWHQYRDHDPGSIWLREQIIQAAQALPKLETLL